MKTEKSRLDMWKNAIIIDKSLFEGKPTHVDDHCTIYLHSSEQDELLKNMTEVLNRFYQQRPQTVKYTFEKLSNNMPCIARFYVDNLFHRGQVSFFINILKHFINQLKKLRLFVKSHQITTMYDL